LRGDELQFVLARAEDAGHFDALAEAETEILGDADPDAAGLVLNRESFVAAR
jgi:hypothetical protein